MGFLDTKQVCKAELLKVNRINTKLEDIIREATPTQKSARKCAATSRDFLRERLQSAFTLANQLRRIAQLKCATGLPPFCYMGHSYVLFSSPKTDRSVTTKHIRPKYFCIEENIQY